MTSVDTYILSEEVVRRRMAAGPFTVAELYTEAERIIDRGAAVRVVNKVIQECSVAGEIFRTGKGWMMAEPDDGDPDDEGVSAWADRRAERSAQRAARVAVADASMSMLVEEVTRLGFVFVRKTEWHFHVRRHGRCFAQWWPSGGKTMLGPKRGPLCTTPAAFVAWLKEQARAAETSRSAAQKLEQP